MIENYTIIILRVVFVRFDRIKIEFVFCHLYFSFFAKVIKQVYIYKMHVQINKKTGFTW